MSNISKTLTTAELSDLIECENIIELTKTNFIECGNALMKIQVMRLWRRDYNTWEVYCQERWGFSRRRATDLINSTVAVQELTKDLGTMVPKLIPNERVAREVAKVAPASRAQVVQEAAKNGTVTAKSIKETTAKIAESKPTEPEVEKDEMGFTIPKHVLENWQLGRRVFQTAMTAISQAKSTIVKLMETEDGKKVHGTLQDARDELGTLYFHVAQKKPIVVCLTCEGEAAKGKETCQMCGRSGVQGKARLEGFPVLIEARIKKYKLQPFKIAGNTFE